MSAMREFFLKQVLPRMEMEAGDRIVDLGCGDGWACRAVATAATQGMVVGIDASGKAIGTARRESVDFDNILYIEAEAEENPWQDNFFSHAILIDTLEGLRDAQAALRHLHRVLSPGGRLWIVSSAAGAQGSPAAAESGPAHQTPWTEQCLRLLETTGWIPCAVESAGGPPDVVLITARKPTQT